MLDTARQTAVAEFLKQTTLQGITGAWIEQEVLFRAWKLWLAEHNLGQYKELISLDSPHLSIIMERLNLDIRRQRQYVDGVQRRGWAGLWPLDPGRKYFKTWAANTVDRRFEG